MTNNTKLKEQLGYLSLLGCIVGSTLLALQTHVQSHNDIYTIINKIKSENAIALQVRVYLLQMHQDLFKMAAQLELPILAFGVDSASPEFNAQKKIMKISTLHKLEFQDNLYNIKFSCSIIENVSPVISISDPLHAKTDALNAFFSNVENVDCQDDSAAYWLFCSSLLKQVSDQNFSVNKDKLGFFIYFYIFGKLIDAFQNREIKPLDRCYMHIDNLWRWPTNEEIKTVIHQAFKHAKILTENILDMTSISLQLYNSLILDDKNNSDEILNSINSDQESLDNISNIENLFISIAATEINKDNWELPDGSYLDYKEGQSNLSFILQPVLNSSAPITSDILDNELFIKINDINREKVTVIALIKL
ncbi:21305_t:CDS:2 [Cetraspora pellucida]|uniref:21305_t:CDS:1 n=1 Tax=Cetraspora pellucida TaxID=1433469 RepID=A0A9N9JD63_9GLOM|nr:21305_t:CDS:2 [Cetraspora pellucida]